MKYIDYRHKIEFGFKEYEEIDHYCKQKGIHWFVSPWDTEAVDFIEQFDPIAIKLASATITDTSLLERVKRTNKPIILSSGMSTMEEVEIAIEVFKDLERLLLAQSTATETTRAATTAAPSMPRPKNSGA